MTKFSLCVVVPLFIGCTSNAPQKRAPGQPTMNELMHRRAQNSRDYQVQHQAVMKRAHEMNPAEAAQLATDLKTAPQDGKAFVTLVRYYEYRVNIRELNALRLWYIEHQPGGKISPGNIDPRFDRPAWERGKAIWLDHLRGCKATPEMVERAADHLDGGDKPLADKLLQDCRNVFEDKNRWAYVLGRHYAQALLGSTAPLTEGNVLRARSPEEAQSPYANRVRATLAASTDAAVLSSTAGAVLMWGRGEPDPVSVADALLNRALAVQPDSQRVRRMLSRLREIELRRRQRELMNMSPGKRAALTPGDGLLLGLGLIQESWMRQNLDVAATQARELLALAARNHSEELYGDAVFEANMMLGKTAMRRGDLKGAVRHLLAASDTPGSGSLRRGEFEMNLPRAIVDAGQRSAVAEFLQRMSAKTTRASEFSKWAEEIRSGVNPDLFPTVSYPGCAHDPC